MGKPMEADSREGKKRLVFPGSWRGGPSLGSSVTLHVLVEGVPSDNSVPGPARACLLIHVGIV